MILNVNRLIFGCYFEEENMKKLLIVLLAVCLIFAMAACANDNAGDEDANAADDNTLIMACNATFPPYEFYESNQIVGIDAEIAAAIADKLGMELQIMDMEFGSIIAAVQTRKADMGVSGITITEDRKKSVDFSTSYTTGVQVVIVKEDSPIATVDDLYAEGATYMIAVQQDTTGDIYSTDDFGDARVSRFNKGADAVMALTTGRADCVIIDDAPARSFVAANTGLKILDTTYAMEDYGIAIAKDNTELLDAVNAALDELMTDGTVQAIIDKYINAE